MINLQFHFSSFFNKISAMIYVSLKLSNKFSSKKTFLLVSILWREKMFRVQMECFDLSQFFFKKKKKFYIKI